MHDTLECVAWMLRLSWFFYCSTFIFYSNSLRLILSSSCFFFYWIDIYFFLFIKEWNAFLKFGWSKGIVLGNEDGFFHFEKWLLFIGFELLDFVYQVLLVAFIILERAAALDELKDKIVLLFLLLIFHSIYFNAKKWT